MENNKIGKIALNRSGHKRNRFNCAHDVSTTASFGDLQPLMCKFMLPDSKMSLGIETLNRFAPLVAPAFARSKQKIWNMFVPLDEVYPNYDAMMSRTAIARAGSTFVPTMLPCISIKQLTMLCLIGADLQIYRSVDKVGAITPGTEDNWYWYKDFTSTTGSTISSFFGTTGNTGFINSNEILSSFSFEGPALDLSFLSSSFFGGPLNIASSSRSRILVPLANDVNSIISRKHANTNLEHISLDSADFVIIGRYRTHSVAEISHYDYAFAFRLSAWGKRMKKVLTGLGYPLSLEDDATVSLLPLLAWFRGYYELFGLNLYSNFEQTACFNLIQTITQSNYCNFAFIGPQENPQWFDTSSSLWQFFREAADCFVTESTDYVSQHLSNPGTSQFGSGAGINVLNGARDFMDSSAFIDVAPYSNRIINAMSSGNGTYPTSTGLTYSGVQHGALDEKMIKLFYRWSNKQSVLGNDIAKLLREMGFGSYVDEVKVDFIGYNEMNLNISDVSATADTFNSADGQGSYLGEYAGRSVNYQKNNTHSYETKKAGYWITYMAVVPEAGYCQGYDHTVRAINPFDIYTPDLDGLGYEATPKAEIVGYGQVSDRASESGSGSLTTFGFTPRYTGWKVQPNKLNGDFANYSTRDAYLPYTLDKIFPINERVLNVLSDTTSLQTVNWQKQMDFNNMPVAGNIWRYNFKYGWMGNLSRIFVADGDTAPLTQWKFAHPELGLDGNTLYEYCHNDFDHMLIHCIMNAQYYAPMKPIGMSFETYDEEAPANSSTEKA